MSQIIVTISSSNYIRDQETLDALKEDCEDTVRDAGGHGVTVEVVVAPGVTR